jgi:hypothetical protein
VRGFQLSIAPTDAWSRTRQLFADQFQASGSDFIFRASQKGEAIKVSSAERDQFIEQFSRDLSRAKWIIWISIVLVLAGTVGVSVVRNRDVFEPAIFIGMALAMIPYWIYFRRAWGAPVRQLDGRMPVAGALSPDEVRRLKFSRMTYSQLAIGALSTLVFPAIAAKRGPLLSGFNAVLMALGLALLVLCAVRAFSKWRFEQDDRYLPSVRATAAPLCAGGAGGPSDDSNGVESKRNLWRFVPLALIVLGFCFVAYTAAGKRVAQQPLFWPALMAAFALWALFSVVQGMRQGRVTPFVRGSWDSYDRQTQPKRYWASMAWNTFIGCVCIWGGFQLNDQAREANALDRCYNDNGTYTSEDVTAACNQVFESSSAALRARPDDATAHFNRGYVYEHRGDLEHAIADFSEVARLTPNDAGAYYYRWAAYKDLGRDDEAASDLAKLSRLDRQLYEEVRPGS